MDKILPGGYQLNDPTWFYLSFLLILAVYFKFSRLWSIRNFDLVLLLLISPGLLLVRDDATLGYGWLFGITGLLLVRTLSDGLITRRPRLEQNMNAAGMAFLCAATFLFLTTKLLTDPPPDSTRASIRKAAELLGGQPASPSDRTGATTGAEKSVPDTVPAGPATSLVAGGVAQLSKAVTKHEPSEAPSPIEVEVVTARMVAILAHLAVILGLTLVGRHIFGDPEVGFAMATLYMLLPCTAYDVGKVNYVLPAALIVWAIWAYRRPFVSGTLLGLASAMMFFPVFLLPLWGTFYGKRGGLRFGTAVVLTAAVIVSSLLLLSNDSATLLTQLLGYFPLANLPFRSPLLQGEGSGLTAGGPPGFYGDSAAYSLPIFVGYLVMLVALTIWPWRKSLAQVITHSAAIVIGTQFWYSQYVGVYVLWYLPLLLLVVFRPLMTNHFAPELKPLLVFGRQTQKPAPQPELVGSTAGSGPSAGS